MGRLSSPPLGHRNQCISSQASTSPHQKVIPGLENDATRPCKDIEKQQGIEVVVQRTGKQKPAGEVKTPRVKKGRVRTMGNRGTPSILLQH